MSCCCCCCGIVCKTLPFTMAMGLLRCGTVIPRFLSRLSRSISPARVLMSRPGRAHISFVGVMSPSTNCRHDCWCKWCRLCWPIWYWLLEADISCKASSASVPWLLWCWLNVTIIRFSSASSGESIERPRGWRSCNSMKTYLVIFASLAIGKVEQIDIDVYLDQYKTIIIFLQNRVVWHELVRLLIIGLLIELTTNATVAG